MTHSFDPLLVRGICFDIDGTLAESDDQIVQRLTRWLRPLIRLRRNFQPEDIARRAVLVLETPTNALLHLLDIIGLDQLLGPVLNGVHRLRGEADMRHPRLVAGVRETLAELEQSYKLAIVTSREHRSTLTFLQTTGLADQFHCVATARTRWRAKPHPAPVLWAAGQMGIHPEHCLMVGDTTVDIRAGVAAGAQTAGVLCGFGQRQELKDAGANLILKSTADLADFLPT